MFKKINLVLGFMLIMSLAMSGNLFAQNNCLDFDGNDDYVSTEFSDDLNTWTIECWVYSYNSPNHSNTSGPIQKGNNFQINWNHEESEHIGTVSLEVEGTWFYASFGILYADTWIHLAATYDGKNLISYKNGILIEKNKEPSGIPSSESFSLTLGKNAEVDNFFFGGIDEVRIWDIARPQSDIQLYMYNNITSTHSQWNNLVIYYQFNETSGTNLPDESSNDIFNGSLNNFALSGLTSNWIASGAPMPVELSSFTSSILNGTVTLNWTTENEINNSGFDIERKRTENANWTKIGFVEGHGTVNITQSYVYKDKNLTEGIYNYRLKQIDHNGNYEYFNLSSDVLVGAPSKFNISQNYPNPFNPKTNISFELSGDSKVSILVFNMLGREVVTLVNGYKGLTEVTYRVECIFIKYKQRTLKQ